MNLKLHLPGDFALRTRWVPLSRRNPGGLNGPFCTFRRLCHALEQLVEVMSQDAPP